MLENVKKICYVKKICLHVELVCSHSLHSYVTNNAI